MLKCNATVDLDGDNEVYVVKVSGSNNITKTYLIPYVEARYNKFYEDPESYAAMAGMDFFVKAFDPDVNDNLEQDNG